MSTDPLATAADVEAIWRPLSADETTRVTGLIARASSKLRQKCPFDIDQRMALFGTDQTAPTALDPVIVSDVVATIVKKFLVNVNGYASESEGVGPFSHSATYVNRYDKTGSDVRGAIQVTESDIDQLRPAVPGAAPFAFRVGVPEPRVLLPHARRATTGYGPASGPAVIPDVAIDSGVE